jgi:hypothetical protein
MARLPYLYHFHKYSEVVFDKSEEEEKEQAKQQEAINLQKIYLEKTRWGIVALYGIVSLA